MEPQIDASEAIAALGITRPVRFEAHDLGEKYLGIPTFGAALLYGFVMRGKTSDVDLIELDWEAIKMDGATAEATIAHELVHIRQIQDHGGTYDEFIRDQYLSPGKDGFDSLDEYFENECEVEARELESEIAPLVKVTR